MTSDRLLWVASQFDFGEIKEIRPFLERGNINLSTFEVETSLGIGILQRVNHRVFENPVRVVEMMVQWCEVQAKSCSKYPQWEPVSMVPVKGGGYSLDLSDEETEVWRLLKKIPNVRSYKSLGAVGDRAAQLQCARETGLGLAINTALVPGLDASTMTGSLPGYRQTDLYIHQLKRVSQGWMPHEPGLDPLMTGHTDEAEFQSRLAAPGVAEMLAEIDRAEPEITQIQTQVRNGRLSLCAIHGDTKIENFLYCADTGKVKSLVDLDTITPFSWLADWGDLARSMVNVAGEKERDLAKIKVDTEIYSALTEGFLESATAPQNEVELMHQAVWTIALELGIRFLADYLRGDYYFGRSDQDPPDLNLVRALCQFRLYQKLREIDVRA